MDNVQFTVVPREQWQSFFDEWSHDHAGERITLCGFPTPDSSDGSGDDSRAERVAQQDSTPDLPLVGISLDPRGSEAGHIILMIGDTLDDNHEHILPDIVEVRARSEADVVDFRYLELAHQDGTFISVQAGDL